jgi:hypothetical protein
MHTVTDNDVHDPGRAAWAPPGRGDVWERRPDGTPVRVVIDPVAGRTWRVWAAGCAGVPGAPAPDCLVFDGGEVIRRVWGVPSGWPTLPAAALLAIADGGPGRAAGAPRTGPERATPPRAD